MTKIKYLTQNANKTYYIRHPLNPELRQFYGKKIIKHSLHTKDYKEAVKKILIITEEIDNKKYGITKSNDSDFLLDYVDLFVEKKLQNEGAHGTYISNKKILYRFIESVGNIRLKYVTEQHLRKYDTYIKRQRFRAKTINLNLIVVKMFFKWLYNQAYIDIPIRTTMLEDVKISKSTVKRRRFTDKEALKIINHVQQFKNHPTFNFRYWAIMLYFYSGCRKMEISQLTKDDIVMKDNIYCIDLNRNLVKYKDTIWKKHLKNDSAVRLVPIHQSLIMDLLDFVKKCKTEFLFDNPDGRKIGYFFQEKYRGKKGLLDYLRIDDTIVDPQFDKHVRATTLHSTRYSFINKLKQHHYKTDAIDQIVGHAPVDKIHDTYTDDYSVTDLFKMINTVHYDASPVLDLVE